MRRHGIKTIIQSRSGLRPIQWIGSSRKDVRGLPQSIRDVFGKALEAAQQSGRSPAVKTLRGFGGGDVLEIVETDFRGTYRLVYTIRLAGFICVLHAFQKKSSAGIRTSLRDMRLIKERLKWAEREYAEANKQKS